MKLKDIDTKVGNTGQQTSVNNMEQHNKNETNIGKWGEPYLY